MTRTALLAALLMTGLAAGQVPPDADIRQILAERIDTYHQSIGIVVGVIEPQGRRIVSYGALAKGDPRPLNGDTVYEIGSITKVFTSLLLADMVERGEVALTDPVAKYLPAGVKVPERGGKQITLVDLATHTSGLPELPSNLNPKDPLNPFADSTVEQLYESLSTYRLQSDIGSRFGYSNVGMALLGNALMLRAGMDYEALVQARITGQLAMAATGISLTADMKTRLAVGHSYSMEPVPNWNMGAYAPVGALRSTANDLLTFLAANLGYTESPVAQAAAEMLKVRRPTGVRGGVVMNLGWGTVTLNGVDIVSHNGRTFGYTSFIGFDPKANIGVVVLSNAGIGVGMDDIGFHLLNPKLPLRTGKELKLPKERKQITLDPKLLDGYVGRYRISQDDILTVTREGSRLFTQRTGDFKVEAYPESNRDYFYKLFEGQITFKADGQGRSTELIYHEKGSTQRARRME